jgi:hypothetical protein
MPFAGGGEAIATMFSSSFSAPSFQSGAREEFFSAPRGGRSLPEFNSSRSTPQAVLSAMERI